MIFGLLKNIKQLFFIITYLEEVLTVQLKRQEKYKRISWYQRGSNQLYLILHSPQCQVCGYSAIPWVQEGTPHRLLKQHNPSVNQKTGVPLPSPRHPSSTPKCVGFSGTHSLLYSVPPSPKEVVKFWLSEVMPQCHEQPSVIQKSLAEWTLKSPMRHLTSLSTDAIPICKITNSAQMFLRRSSYEGALQCFPISEGSMLQRTKK